MIKLTGRQLASRSGQRPHGPPQTTRHHQAQKHSQDDHQTAEQGCDTAICLNLPHEGRSRHGGHNHPIEAIGIPPRGSPEEIGLVIDLEGF